MNSVFRTRLVSGTIAALLVASWMMLRLRAKPEHVLPAVQPVAPAFEAAPDPSLSASVSAAVPTPATPVTLRAAFPAAPPTLSRTLRVAAMGWELGAPGIVANAGLKPSAASEFTKAGLDVEIAVIEQLSKVEAALARGGMDPYGADVAILPLPIAIASMDRLRALGPEIFVTVGWSAGRDVVEWYKSSLSPRTLHKKIEVMGVAGSAPSFLAMFMLDEVGVSLERITFVAPPVRVAKPVDAASADDEEEEPEESEETLERRFITIDKSARISPDDGITRKSLVSTAEASRLIPYVAVAQGNFIEKHQLTLAKFSHVWLTAQSRMKDDDSSAARTVSGIEGAPEALGLLTRLSLIERATVRDNLEAYELAGESPLSTRDLADRAWTYWRSQGTLSSPPPHRPPVRSEVVRALGLLSDPPGPSAPMAMRRSSSDDIEPILIKRQTKGEADLSDLMRQVGGYARAFPRSPLRVTIREAEAGKVEVRTRFFADAVRRFGLSTDHIGRGTVEGGVAAIEILPVP